MFLSADLVNLLLYCVQQLGVALGFGGATVLLIAYLIAMRDGVVDAKEAQYYRAVRGVLNYGLLFIIVSGVGISVLHLMAGQGDILLAPAYLFKWLLIFLALGLTLYARKKDYWITEGLSGGTWYALFLVHILAPVTGWLNLLTLYGVWMVGFMLCWAALVYVMRDKKAPAPVEKLLPKINKAAPKAFTPPPAHPPLGKPLPPPPPPPAPKSITTPPSPKPITPPPNPAPQKPPAPPVPISPVTLAKPPASSSLPPPPPVKLAPKEVPLQKPEELKPELPTAAPVAAPQAPLADPDQHPGLPAIRVMPKTPADIENAERATFVKLD